MKRLEWEHQPNLSALPSDMLKDRLEWLKDRRRKLTKSLVSLNMEIDETNNALNPREDVRNA